MEHDKVFNLQLTIQKLQEELSLYRNGADGQELFLLLAEKEAEIKSLKLSGSGKNENLKKLAKKSAEVLARCDRLQSEYDTLQFEHSDLIQEKKRLAAQVEVLKTSNVSFAALCQEKKVIITQMEEELGARDASVEKLLARCAALVSQKNEKHKEFEAESKEFAAERSEKNKQMKELMDELERAMRFNTEAKERLNREHANGLELSAQLLRSQNDVKILTDSKMEMAGTSTSQTAEIRRLMQAKSEVETELSRTSASLAAANSTAKNVECQFGEILNNRDKEILEMQISIVTLTETAAKENKRVQEVYRAELARFKTEAESAIKKARKLEAEREVHLSQLKEMELLRVTSSELEDKIKRQDQYMKSRLLKDKTNMSSSAQCPPEPSEPSYRPPSARALAFAASTGTSTGAGPGSAPLTVPSGDVRSSQVTDKGHTVKAMR